MTWRKKTEEGVVFSDAESEIVDLYNRGVRSLQSGDIGSALSIFEELSLESHYPSAMFNTGLLYLQGHGPRNLSIEKAKFFLEMASDSGHPKADVFLEQLRIYSAGAFIPQPDPNFLRLHGKGEFAALFIEAIKGDVVKFLDDCNPTDGVVAEQDFSFMAPERINNPQSDRFLFEEYIYLVRMNNGCVNQFFDWVGEMSEIEYNFRSREGLENTIEAVELHGRLNILLRICREEHGMPDDLAIYIRVCILLLLFKHFEGSNHIEVPSLEFFYKDK